MQNSSKQRFNNIQIVGSIASSAIGIVALIGLALYWLVEQATQGNTTAVILVTAFSFLALLMVGFLMYAGIAYVQSRIQRAAFENNMELMKTNAIENQQILSDVTKGLLLASKAQNEQLKIQPPLISEQDYLQISSNVIESRFED